MVLTNNKKTCNFRIQFIYYAVAFLDTQSRCHVKGVLETWMDYQAFETMAWWIMMNYMMCIAMWRTFMVNHSHIIANITFLQTMLNVLQTVDIGKQSTFKECLR